MTINELLADFGKRINMTLTPDASSTVNLDVDGLSLSVIGIEELNQVVLLGVIGEIPPADRQERLYKALLMANHNFMGTHGATFSVNPESGDVCLCRTMPLPLLDSDKFFTAVEEFVNTLDTWHKIVADFRGAELDAQGHEIVQNPEGVQDIGSMGSFMQV